LFWLGFTSRPCYATGTCKKGVRPFAMHKPRPFCLILAERTAPEMNDNEPLFADIKREFDREEYINRCIALAAWASGAILIVCSFLFLGYLAGVFVAASFLSGVIVGAARARVVPF
jgi:hypothetical protein